MRARSPHESHRAATPLELFFDLVFVVAIAQAAAGLHHAISEAHAVEGLISYAMVFFAIWWAWMNFTWFASAYDCDDVPYRIAVFVQITGALIMAAGVPGMFEVHGPTAATLVGYIVMRMAMVAQWLRAAHADPPRAACARRYALGITVLQVAWIAMYFVPAWWGPLFIALALAEMAVPIWAESVVPTTWHPHHIAERYGLLTLIVLGESILSSTVAVQGALSAGGHLSDLLPIIVGGLLIAFSIWWMYFDRPVHDLLTSLRKGIFWGYGHYFIFAAAAAAGAGLAVNVDYVAHHAKISGAAAGAAVAIPVALYLVCLWILHDRPGYASTRAFGPIVAVLVLVTPFAPQPVLVTGVLLAATIAVKLTIRAAGERREPALTPEP
jgi:low temperature requirement protein LtrA